MPNNNKVEIRFPADHPIWSYPAGQRPSKVRELVDTALRIENVLADIKAMVGDVLIRVKAIEGILSGVEQKGENKFNHPNETISGPTCQNPKAIDPKIVKNFLSKL